MSETSSRRQEGTEARRRQILAAAIEVFARKGFHSANVSDVAARAGVSQGTIYLYFKSKEELLETALLSFFEDFGEQAMPALAGRPTAAAELRALGRSMAEFCRAAEGLFPLFLGYWASSPRRDLASQLWTDLLVQYKDLIVAIILKGIHRGEFMSVDAEPLVWAMMAAYDGLAAYLMLMPDLDLERTIEVFVETLLRGLIANGGKDGEGEKDTSEAV